VCTRQGADLGNMECSILYFVDRVSPSASSSWRHFFAAEECFSNNWLDVPVMLSSFLMCQDLYRRVMERVIIEGRQDGYT
jgi:hypothetical protein